MALMEQTAPAREETKQERGSSDADMQRRAAAVRSFRDSYRSLMNRTGFGSKSSTNEMIQWLTDMKLTDDTAEQKSIHWREDFIRKDGSLILQQGESLYETFTSHMRNAAPYISKDSYNRWFERLYDTREHSSSTSSFKMKLAWVQSELGNYVSRWKKVAEDRDALVKNPRFKELIREEPDLAILNNREQCLDLPYPERRGLVSKAMALINATDTSRLDLYASAKSKLEIAAGNTYILNGKVGVWLERIFASTANPKKISEFVNGSGSKSLEGLINNWAAVKGRFDVVEKKFQERGEEAAARGFTMKTPQQFLSMHYAQRLSYVKQAEDRLDDAEHIVNELPIFLKIRHAMDMKDWTEASDLIADAKLMHLKDSDWPRLKSMENHIKKFSGKENGESMKIETAHKRLNMLVGRVQRSHSEMVEIVTELLNCPNPNMAIGQLRWITYNNIWCRTHGPPYLNDAVTRKGASDDQIQLTKHRAENGLDTGRDDALGHATSDATYFRKQETSKYKATYLHADMSSGGVVSALGEKMKREQNPRWLYWTTLCPHTNGEPKPEQWMREFMQILTEMRSLTRISPDVSLRSPVATVTANNGYATSA